MCVPMNFNENVLGVHEFKKRISNYNQSASDYLSRLPSYFGHLDFRELHSHYVLL